MDKLISPTEQKREEYIQERLEAFTMAAMQGAMASMTERMAKGRPMDTLEAEFISQECIMIARATLSELSKQK